MLTVLAIAGTIAGMVQSALALGVRVVGVHPDLVMIAAVSWCLLRGRREALVFAAFGGLALDMQSAGPLGLLTLATVAATLAASIGEINVFRTVASLPYVTIVTATAVYYLIVIMGVRLMGRPLALGPLLATTVAPAMALNLVCMLPAYWLARRFSGGLAPSSADWGA
jgi:rod shape-determining protein MreD